MASGPNHTSDNDWDCNFEFSFEHPFAQNMLVFAGLVQTADSIEFVINHEERSGVVLCTLRPAFRCLHLQSKIASLSSSVNDGSCGEHQRRDAVAQIILAFGMTTLCYVWMGFCTPTVVVRAAAFDAAGVRGLTDTQITFWRDLFLKGLREHLFTNGIRSFDGKGGLDDFQLVVERRVQQEKASTSRNWQTDQSASRRPRVLVPMGAGKDSTVAWEMLGRVACEDGKCERQWFFCEGETREFSKCWRYQALADASGDDFSNVLVSEFFLGDEAAFNRSRNSSLTLVGHPWACLVGFASILVALLEKFDYVAVGNERSAGLGNRVMWEGEEVNHQWDKSFAFERAMHEYLRLSCHSLVHYFSVLAPFWDVQVALLFAHLCPQHLPLILSCNQPEGINGSRWCAKCAKCAFVVAVLGAFFPVRSMRAVFGDDLFESADIAGHLDQVAGLDSEVAIEDADGPGNLLTPCLPALGRDHCQLLEMSWKPFECVGSAAETRLALRLVAQRYASEDLPMPRYFTSTRQEALRKQDGCCSDLLREWGEDHLLPVWLEETAAKLLEDALLAHNTSSSVKRKKWCG